MWKIGIISFIWITQSKVRPIENLAFLKISVIFETLLLWTASFKWSLWYQFSTQHLIPYNFQLIGLAKFRHLAILAIFGGYFGYFLFWIWLDFSIFAHFGTSTPWDENWHFFVIKKPRDICCICKNVCSSPTRNLPFHITQVAFLVLLSRLKREVFCT